MLSSSKFNNHDEKMHPGGGEDEEEASIYFRVLGPNGMDWYAIRNDSKTPENDLLSPILVDNKTHQSFSTAAALGPKIYVFGGAELGDLQGTVEKDRTFNTVYSIDTNCPEKGGGWSQVASLQHHRGSAHAVPVNGKIIIFIGFSYAEEERPRDAEIFDPQSNLCNELKQIPWPIVMPSAHAVLDGGKRILLYSAVEEIIYSYDVENDQYRPYCGPLSRMGNKGHIETMAVVDGVVYIAGHNLKWGQIFALDVSRRRPKAHPVLGLDSISWLPGRSTETVYPPYLYLVAISTSKLALLWCAPSKVHLNVYCAKMEVSKKTLDSGQTIFEAKNVKRSKYIVNASSLDLCLPVFTTWKEEEQENSDDKNKNGEEEEVNKDIEKEEEKENSDAKNKDGEEINKDIQKKRKKKSKRRINARKFKMLEKAARDIIFTTWKEEKENSDDKNKNGEEEEVNKDIEKHEWGLEHELGSAEQEWGLEYEWGLEHELGPKHEWGLEHELGPKHEWGLEHELGPAEQEWGLELELGPKHEWGLEHELGPKHEWGLEHGLGPAEQEWGLKYEWGLEEYGG